jgi:hypothetical protein
MECKNNVTGEAERFFCNFPPYDDCGTDPEFHCCFPLFPISGSDPTNPFWPWNMGQIQLQALSKADWYTIYHKQNTLFGILKQRERERTSENGDEISPHSLNNYL